MAYEVVSSSPNVDDFTLLTDHQQQTPGTFFGGKPVLHLHCPQARLKLSRAEVVSQPHFVTLQNSESSGAQGGIEDDVIKIENIDIWVTSRYLTIFNNLKAHGIQIPYPTVSIHALEGDAVLLELDLSDANTADEDLEFLQLRMVPSKTEQHCEPTDATEPTQANGHSHASPVRALYDAISACQELNPDPAPEDEEGGFDETAPGATGWITSDNMADFMDENGNFRMPTGATVIGDEEDVADDAGEGDADGLGVGAGRTRTAAEVEGEDGADDEAKWQRTG